MTAIHTRIAGIPAIALVTHFLHRDPAGPWAGNSDEARGYTECEFTVLDSRGRPAPWLERKLSRADSKRIEAEIVQAASRQEIDA
jgi:hypothetical protein